MGVLTGMADQVATGLILAKNIRIQGAYVGSVAMFRAMNAAITRSRMKPVVSDVFPFEKAPEALRRLEGASHVGKIVVEVAQ
jgi:D-arabinose 1-dehydrogenase-like Zn-dependent alcohol dehydrogenase